jgi:hypothetical protein
MLLGSKAFAIPFSKLEKWNPASYALVGWKWDDTILKPLSWVMERKAEPVQMSAQALTSDLFITVRFGGAIEQRIMKEEPTPKGPLFWAERGDLVYSKIDCRNGAIGIIPTEFDKVVVTNEFPVYKIREDRIIPLYLWLVLQTTTFLEYVNSIISGTSGRKRVQPSEFERIKIPIPEYDFQLKVVRLWENAQHMVRASEKELQDVTDELNAWLWSQTDKSTFSSPVFILKWSDINTWDVKNARATAFRNHHPAFVPFGSYAEESTLMVKPSQDPLREWPVYGVNNKIGVFYSHKQLGRDFNTPYKHIREGWFFHNPTRSAVGSLGLVQEVPKDAITSPEYQVWRLRDLGNNSLNTDFVATLIRTRWFLQLIQFHRVGAVKQRLYVENLLAIPVPTFPRELQMEISVKRNGAIARMRVAQITLQNVKRGIEEIIVGVRPIQSGVH